MLRRALALVLTLASVIALAVPAAEFAPAAPATCCCGGACDNTRCPARDCAPPASVARASVPAAAVEQRAAAARPARIAVAASFSKKISALSARRARVPHAALPGAAARVALFQAHCSLRL
jgi:hypothetical protein